MENQRLIEEFHKNSVEIVKVHVQEWRGLAYIDLRVWCIERSEQNGAGGPTKKGLTIRAELLPDLIGALQKAQAYLDRDGLEKCTEKPQDRRYPEGEGNPPPSQKCGRGRGIKQ